MSFYPVGTKVQNAITYETATVVGEKDFWITNRGYVKKIMVDHGDHSEPNTVRYWMPTSCKVIEPSEPKCVESLKHLAKVTGTTLFFVPSQYAVESVLKILTASVDLGIIGNSRAVQIMTEYTKIFLNQEFKK